MGRKVLAFLASIASVPVASAQITGGGYYGGGILDMISHLLGINIYRPYAAAGVAATLGILWVSTYVVFKVAIQFMDNNLGDGHDNYFADAVGIDREEDRNLLAVLTLLIVLTMLGTGAFAGIINGWQSLIILAFAFALLAGTFFILFGGIGATIGGTAYGAGLGAQATARGVGQLNNAIEDIGDLQGEVDDEEEEEEEDIDEGDEEEADQEARVTEEELEDIINALNETVEDMDDLMAEEINELGAAIENLEELVELLELED